MHAPTGPAGTLVRASAGESFVIAGTSADPLVARRLSALGWRTGERARVVLKAAGGALVVDLHGGRVALSRALVRQLAVEAQ